MKHPILYQISRLWIVTWVTWVATVLVVVFLLLASTAGAAEIHQNGFGGITPLNTTGLMVFNESVKRSAAFESDSLVLSAEFSILETNGDIRDFSLFDNDLTRQNEPIFVDSTFRTALETVNLEPLNLNVTATKDALIKEEFPGNNYGSDVLLTITSLIGNSDIRSFVQWDISSIPSTATITEALMWLNKTSDFGAFPRTYEAKAADSSWTELTITWTNQPGSIGSAETTVITTSEGWYSWDITTIVQNWIDGTWTNNGIKMLDSVENSVVEISSNFDSRDSTNDPPFLNVNYTISANQWANTSHSESLDMEITNVSMIWWGQTRQTGIQHITGKGCSSTSYVYGLYLESDNTISAFLADNACSWDTIQTGLPSGGLDTNRTYGIGAVFENNTWGTVVHFWLDGDWIYNETSTERVGDTGSDYYVGRSTGGLATCNCTHDEILVFKDRLDNSTMQLLTTQEHDIVIRSGPTVVPQGFGGLWFALPWVLVFGLIGWIGYLIFVAWREAIK